jgi:hypothetical protein
VIPYDKSTFENLKKVKVSINTKFFAPNNVTPLIWYYKTGSNSFEYFTSHGIHPIHGESLSKITQNHIDKYIPKYKNDEDKTEIVVVNNPEAIPEKEKPTEKKPSKKLPETKQKFPKWIWIATSTIALFICVFYGSIYFIANSKTNDEKTPVEQNNLTNTDEECMAWNGDKYTLTNCSDSIHPSYNTKVIPYDKSTFENLKKVKVSINTKFFAPNNVTPLIW